MEMERNEFLEMNHHHFERLDEARKALFIARDLTVDDEVFDAIDELQTIIEKNFVETVFPEVNTEPMTDDNFNDLVKVWFNVWVKYTNYGPGR